MLPSFTVLAQISGEAGPGIFELFMRSGPTAKIVFAILGIMSVGSWAIIASKYVEFRRAARQTERFLEVFHRSQRFSEVNAAADKLRASPLVAIFQSGYVEIDAQVKASAEGGAAPSGAGYRLRSLEGLQRTLQRAVGVEVQVMSRGTGFLATTAAASPFIGLFGTVVGIMVAFNEIGISGSSSLATVAPGIAEALVNTAAGLGAAIPALIGYNYYANRIRTLRADMHDFVLEFVNLAERNFT
jgi:biopolymer transport protein TolQ